MDQEESSTNSNSIISRISPIPLLDIVHDSLINTTAYFADKLDKYNEFMQGKMEPTEETPFSMQQIHIDFINVAKKKGKYRILLEFANEYQTIPYNFRAGYLARFFTLNF